MNNESEAPRNLQLNDPEAIMQRIRQIADLQRDCEVILNGRQGDFWGHLRRTIQAQAQKYLSDCYEAAERSDKEIRNFLGRMEALDWVVALVDKDFEDQARRLHEERRSLEALLEQEKALESAIENDLQGPMYQNPGLI